MSSTLTRSKAVSGLWHGATSLPEAAVWHLCQAVGIAEEGKHSLCFAFFEMVFKGFRQEVLEDGKVL